MDSYNPTGGFVNLDDDVQGNEAGGLTNCEFIVVNDELVFRITSKSKEIIDVKSLRICCESDKLEYGSNYAGFIVYSMGPEME